MDRCLLLAKKEVTYGLDPVPVAANTLWAEEVSLTFNGTRVTSNPSKPGVGATADQTYGEHVQVSFKIPLAGSGVAGTAPKWGPLMKACAWSETLVADTSVTYAEAVNPLTADSMTLVWRTADKQLHKVVGWRGKVDLELSAGGRPMLAFTGKGLHTDVVTAGSALAHADASFTGWLDSKPVASGTTTFTFAGVSDLGLRKLSFQQNDNVKFTDVPGQENVELRGERSFTGEMTITRPLSTVLNLETKWKSAAVDAWSMVHGAVAGNIVTVNGRSQVTQPSYGREDEIDTATAGLKLVPSSLTSDDALSIVLT